nr:hypothetical protein [Oscillochloris trichoides]
MRTRLVRRPGQPGTKELVEQYGERLICVRYRYDERSKQRHKTIELIIESTAWEPPMNPESIVSLHIGTHEREIQNSVRNAGGIWKYKQQVWQLRYDHVLELGLTDRIIDHECNE